MYCYSFGRSIATFYLTFFLLGGFAKNQEQILLIASLSKKTTHMSYKLINNPRFNANYKEVLYCEKKSKIDLHSFEMGIYLGLDFSILLF